MTTKYHSTDNQQQKLKILSEKLTDRLEEVLDSFGIQYSKDKKKLICACPVHGGDNIAACNIFYVGSETRGNWMCRTNQCEKTFIKSALGLMRGILSHQKYGWTGKGDKTVSFADTIKYVEDFLQEKVKDIKVDKIKIEKNKFIQFSDTLDKPVQTSEIKRETVKKSLSIPAQYYMDRGFSSKILVDYDVGLCTATGKEMSERVVVPIYDDNHEFMIGCTGRSVYSQCEKCRAYHNPLHSCPTDEKKWMYSKWKHSGGFRAQDNLFNFWYALESIKQTATVILVESPGNVLKLVQAGIPNVVATFGAHLTDSQKFKLDCSGAMTMILLLDNDEAGNTARVEIREMCNRTYRVFDIYVPPEFNDIGDMPDIQDICEEIRKIK